MERGAKVYVAGHRGLVGGAIVRRLQAAGFERLVTRTRAELDLCRQADVEAFFAAERPDYVFLAAARVGGIHANSTYPADFIRENLLVQTHAIDAAWRSGVRKLLFLGSSCIYPRDCPQPMREEHLLSGPLEPTNEPYAIAKIAGIRTVQAYARQHGLSAVCLQPTNLYGPGDNFHPENSHVLPALLRRFHQAKQEGASAVEVWGSGTPRREFLHVDDLADACLFLMERHDDPAIVNVGTGEEVTIAELARLVREVVGFEGELRFDPSKPDGTPRKLLDVSRLRGLGWVAKIGLREGLETTYRWFLEQVDAGGVRVGSS